MPPNYSELKAQRDKLLEALRNIADGNWLPKYTRGRCKHLRFDFEHCNDCIEDYAREALARIAINDCREEE